MEQRSLHHGMRKTIYALRINGKTGIKYNVKIHVENKVKKDLRLIECGQMKGREQKKEEKQRI